MYSLLSASVLALDLVKHPCGAQVSDVVDRALALTADELAALESVSRSQGAGLQGARELVRQTARATPRAPVALRRAGEVLRTGDAPGPAATTALEVLSRTLLGSLDDLLSLLADRPLAARDAVAATWVGAGAGPEVLAAILRLRQAWDTALPPWPRPLPDDGYGEHAPDLRDLLDAAGRLDESAWARVEQAHAARRGSLRWSQAMHVASRAAADSGRVLPVARAQLAGARVLRLSGASTRPGAGGIAMAVVAAVQATCVLDLLPLDDARTLLAPWQAGVGAL